MGDHPYDQNFLDRLYAKLDIRGDDDCWIWTGGRNSQGYGKIMYRGKTIVTHRAMHEIHIGPIPMGYAVDHISCSNKSCANPKHLRACTWSENLLHRGANKGTKSGIRNVTFHPDPGRRKPWQVVLMVRGKRVFSATFATKEEAAQAAHDARVEHLGWDGSDRAAA